MRGKRLVCFVWVIGKTGHSHGRPSQRLSPLPPGSRLFDSQRTEADNLNLLNLGVGMHGRFVDQGVKEALSDTPVVLTIAPRRVAKTTLVRKADEASRTYIMLDDQTVLAAAKSAPTGFSRRLVQAIFDEIQRTPDFLVAIKKTVDVVYSQLRRFLLTGFGEHADLGAHGRQLGRTDGNHPNKASRGSHGLV
ncbi:AAA family ATPase [Gluconobacter kondonii]|uniref:AAA family ATPase n=1 Tax=Gluconobacter kondonii TaxID=941463 RepID=UPI0038D01E5F